VPFFEPFVLWHTILLSPPSPSMGCRIAAVPSLHFRRFCYLFPKHPFEARFPPTEPSFLLFRTPPHPRPENLLLSKGLTAAFTFFRILACNSHLLRSDTLGTTACLATLKPHAAGSSLRSQSRADVSFASIVLHESLGRGMRQPQFAMHFSFSIDPRDRAFPRTPSKSLSRGTALS